MTTLNNFSLPVTSVGICPPATIAGENKMQLAVTRGAYFTLWVSRAVTLEIWINEGASVVRRPLVAGAVITEVMPGNRVFLCNADALNTVEYSYAEYCFTEIR